MCDIGGLTNCSFALIVDVEQVSATYGTTAIFHYLEHILETLGSTKQM